MDSNHLGRGDAIRDVVSVPGAVRVMSNDDDLLSEAPLGESICPGVAKPINTVVDALVN